MENTRGSKSRKSRRGKAWQFVALPHYVLDCHAFHNLSNSAKALLLEVARQYNGQNNGDLTVMYKQLNLRGWSSNDVISKAKAELLNCGFIQETRKGARPNKASLYALTWQPLNIMEKYEMGINSFRKNAFLENQPP